jgi:N-acetylneuraminic acid mutarotase
MKSWNRFGVFTLFTAALVTVVGCSGGSSTTKAPATYTIGGSVTGLTGAGLVLQDNAGDNLTVPANATSFTFATAITSGNPYAVTVLTQPAGFNCTVASGSGTASANVTSVAIACVQAYTIGGSVFGLSGTGLVLQDNGANNLTVSATATSYSFVFPGAIPTGGAPYSVTVFSNPAGQACTIANPIGTATASVLTADVSCTTLPAASFTVGGTVSGLTGPGLILQNAAGINDDDLLPINANGAFTFANPIASAGAYNVTVLTQPANRNCTITNGSGSLTANVTNVSVICLGEFTWMGGGNTLGMFGAPLAGVYGTLGTADPANIPGGRQQALTWVDSLGKTWLFGGYGEDSTGTGYGGQLNDLWRFDPTLGAEGEWTWMGGSNLTPDSTTAGANGEPGVYGTQGVAAATNIPGGREQASSWLDASGKLWMFGGEGIDEQGFTGQLNDLWMFDSTLGTSGEWTWMGGSSTTLDLGFQFTGQSGVYGTLGTPSPTNIPGGRYGAVSWKDAAGNFWMFGGSGTDSIGSGGSTAYLNDLWKYTPSATGDTGEWTWMGGSNIGNQPGLYGAQGTPDPTNIPGGRDAAVGWTDASGNFWLFGGIGQDADNNFGYLNDLWEYTPGTGAWTWMGGSTTVPQAYSGRPGVYGALGTPATTTVPGGRFSPMAWTDASGNFWLFGGQGFDSTGTQGYLDDMWEYTPSATGDSGQWKWVDGSTIVGRSGGQSGVYGVLGIAGDNIPGGRFGAAPWVDAAGNLWMFGGQGYDSIGNNGNLNDVWKYQP